MDRDTYRRQFSEDSAPGWEAIDRRLAALYDEQEPVHWASSVPYALGGKDPLDGISRYRSSAGGVEHWHFVGYGLSELYYDEDSAGKEFSRFGFELSFRLPLAETADGEPWWVGNLLQNIARYVYQSKRWFEPGHFMPANGPIRLGADTAVTALAMLQDPELGVIDTPHGRVEFIQLFGITQPEYEALRARQRQCEALIEAERTLNPLLVTTLARRPP